MRTGNRKKSLRPLFSTAVLAAAALVLVLPGSAAAGNFTKSFTKAAALQTSWTEGQPSVGQDTAHKKLAIVIDDLGNDMDGTQEIMELPIKVTVAVMPFMRSTERDARMAHERGFDVLVHLPMEPNHGKPEWLGPGAIMSSLTDSEVRQRVEKAIDDVPYAVGINNHMGSKITADPRIMSIVLDVCRERGLFFLDSRTNYKTVVGKLCREKGMPDIGNQFFLDDQYNEQHISKQMQKVMHWMKEHESCVIIGHVGVPGTKTAGVISRSVSQMPDVLYVTLSELVQAQSGSSGIPGIFPLRPNYRTRTQ